MTTYVATLEVGLGDIEDEDGDSWCDVVATVEVRVHEFCSPFPPPQRDYGDARFDCVGARAIAWRRKDDPDFASEEVRWGSSVPWAIREKAEEEASQMHATDDLLSVVGEEDSDEAYERDR